jgi:galactose-1-phosphate uridylyltransferase
MDEKELRKILKEFATKGWHAKAFDPFFNEAISQIRALIPEVTGEMVEKILRDAGVYLHKNSTKNVFRDKDMKNSFIAQAINQHLRGE